ncbi:protein GRIM REAPER-like [Gossypium arboreum]|uniref:protein GRIM REAPER-like n=1 Tax=Gossypium arboreum TaxID=29729 RepID=UPI0022F1A6E3|nr:protein GRIM REAPER-like [Gossypium arboreum]
MASNTLNLIAILSLTISILLSSYPQPAFSIQMEDFDGEEEYVLDHPVIIPNLRSRSRFLKTSPTKDKIRKGADCDPHPSLNICKGISKKQRDRSQIAAKRIVVTCLVIGTICGKCATGASSGNALCGGVCTNVANNVNHLRKCGNRGSSGVQ